MEGGVSPVGGGGTPGGRRRRLRHAGADRSGASSAARRRTLSCARRDQGDALQSKRQSKSSIAVADADRPLFEALRALRLRLAAEAKLPPYIICTDVTLAELAAARPADAQALHGITGLGNSKIARYGAALLATIAEHTA